LTFYQINFFNGVVIGLTVHESQWIYDLAWTGLLYETILYVRAIKMDWTT